MDNIKKWNLDSDNMGFFFKRELEQIRSKAYDIKKVPLKAREVFPLDFEIHEGAEFVVYQQYDMIGQAQVIANYATDLPDVDVRGEEFQSRVKSLGDKYTYSVQDIRAAMKGQKPLQQRKADAARKAMAIKENKIAFNGEPTHNIQGFFTNPNIPRVAAPVGASTSTEWANKTPDEILDDLHFMATYASDITDDVEQADTICLPVKQYNLIRKTKMGQFDTRTIYQAFMDASDYIKEIKSIPECKGAAEGGLDMAFAYRKDPDALQLVIPMEFLQHAAQQKGLEFQIPCEQRIGGVVVYLPLSVVFMEGV